MEDMSLKADAVLEMHTTSDVAGSAGATCALLTPAIKAKLREMDAGQVLEVRVGDLTAREDLASWCRLSGNELLAAREISPGILNAYVRKKKG
jgi:tRNA 2-thiouridine synthesizing protein A